METRAASQRTAEPLSATEPNQVIELPIATADEPRARLTRILADREKPSPDEWRLGRAVQVLELAGTPEARALLKFWAAVDGSPVTEPARGALQRLGKP